MADKLLRIPKVAEIIDTSVPRAYELVRLGVIPGVVRLGRQIRVNPNALAEWMAGGGAAQQNSKEGSAEGVTTNGTPDAA